MEFKDYYKVLGVAPEADDKQIKTAYRRLARRYHPDVSKEADAEEQFKAVNEAYEVLGNAERRREYDQLRASGWRGGDNFRASGVHAAEGFGNGDFSDFFEVLFGRARAAQAARAARPPAETRVHLDIDIETAHSGGSQRVSVDGRTLDIRIPEGIAPGQHMRLKGQGGQGRDLLVEIGYRPHPVFRVEGRDVLVDARVPAWDAALGGSLEVRTLGGPVELKIPAGSQSGRRMRLRGRGLKGKPAGDQIVVLQVEAPKPANAAQREAWEALRKAFA